MKRTKNPLQESVAIALWFPILLRKKYRVKLRAAGYNL